VRAEAQRLTNGDLFVACHVHRRNPRHRPADDRPHRQRHDQQQTEVERVLTHRPGRADDDEPIDAGKDAVRSEPVETKNAQRRLIDLLGLVSNERVEQPVPVRGADGLPPLCRLGVGGADPGVEIAPGGVGLVGQSLVARPRRLDRAVPSKEKNLSKLLARKGFGRDRIALFARQIHHLRSQLLGAVDHLLPDVGPAGPEGVPAAVAHQRLIDRRDLVGHRTVLPRPE
jgi:hypothetical protein